MKTLIFTLFAIPFIVFGDDISEIKSLDRTSAEIKSIRSDNMRMIKTIKSLRSPDELPEMRFYSYKINSKDRFFDIVTATGMDMDTIVSVNSLKSSGDNAGRIIYIPNMRGVIHFVRKGESIDLISKEYDIPAKYILKINKIDSLNKKSIFIPMGKLTLADRQRFLNAGFTTPVASEKPKLTSGFGKRKDPITGQHDFHEGIDIGCAAVTPVRSARDGTIIVASYEGGYGNLVIVRHSNGYETYYGHLSKFLVNEGQHVKKGDILALSGNTGRTTGPHLHYEIRKNGKAVNPKYFSR